MKRTALLDVNVLIALLDPLHVHHDAGHRWFASRGDSRWATCAITQNAVLRILGNPRYPNSPGSPAVVSEILSAALAHPQHEFWDVAPSLMDPQLVDRSMLVDSGQITDTYLLALAVSQNGVLATLDQRLTPKAVRGGEEALLLIGG